MADLDDDSVIVTLPPEGDGTAVMKVEDVGKQTTDDPISDLKGQFETLKGTLNNTTQRLAGAEQQIIAKDQEIAAVRQEVAASQIDTVTSGLAAAEAEASSAEKEYIAAAEAGDFAAQARAQRKISAAESRIQRLQEAKADLEDAKPTKTQQKAEPRQQQVDPVEAVASSMAPRAAAWIRSHPDCITDKSKNAKMMATHYAALADGLQEGGDDYFARLDAMVNAKPVKAEPRSEPKAEAVIRRPSAPAAPGGNPSGGMNGGGTEVRLTAREVAAANDGTHTWNYDDPGGKFKKDTPIGTAEFARRKSIMTRRGEYDRSFETQ